MILRHLRFGCLLVCGPFKDVYLHFLNVSPFLKLHSFCGSLEVLGPVNQLNHTVEWLTITPNDRPK